MTSGAAQRSLWRALFCCASPAGAVQEHLGVTDTILRGTCGYPASRFVRHAKGNRSPWLKAMGNKVREAGGRGCAIGLLLYCIWCERMSHCNSASGAVRCSLPPVTECPPPSAFRSSPGKQREAAGAARGERRRMPRVVPRCCACHWCDALESVLFRARSPTLGLSTGRHAPVGCKGG